MDSATLEPIQRLSRDLAKAAIVLSRNEARYLVDSYYQLQEVRKGTANQISSMSESGEPCSVLTWFRDNSESLEGQIKRALGSYASGQRVGRWSQSVIGIGPVIAAGLLAHIDIEKAPTVGHIWRFAGLDPTVEWNKGERRPFNANLKVLCWKIGQSFLKFSNHDDCLYGHLLRKRWELEKSRNDAGKFAEQAAKKLAKFKIGKSTEAYKAYSAGILPPAHILQRSCRYATKLFLAHWQHVAWESQFGVPPVKPYVFEHLAGHANYIAPPGWPCE